MLVLLVLAAYSTVIYQESSIGEIPFPQFTLFFIEPWAFLLLYFFVLFSLRASYHSPSETLGFNNVYIYIYIQGADNKFPDFSTDSTHMKH